MSLSDFSVKRPVATLMVYVGILFFGVAAFLNLSVDFLPAIQIPELTVRTLFPDSSPEEVEKYVTIPVESVLGSVAGVKGSSSVSREGLSVVTIRFHWGANMDYAQLAVREKLDQLRSSLPGEAGRPTILRVMPAAEPIMTIAVSTLPLETVQRTGELGTPRTLRPGDGSAELFRLKDLARGLVKKRIEQLDGVARATVVGGAEREIHIDLDMQKLEALGITTGQVTAALSGASVSEPGGMIRHGHFRYSLRTLGEIHHVEELREIVVRTADAGSPVRVRDIAYITDTYRKRMGITRYNGREVVAVQVQKDAGANTVQVSRHVYRAIDHLRNENPGLVFNVVSDQAEFISASINDVEAEILLGAALAFTALFVLLGKPRTLFAVGLTIPLSILATFAVMYVLEINLNIISLTGLALGIGMLGDNSLIVVENMTRLSEEGMGLEESVPGGTGGINLALTASTLTNVAVFLPIILVEGVWSQLFRDMAITMTVSLVVSLLVAMTLVPMLLLTMGELLIPKKQILDYEGQTGERESRFPEIPGLRHMPVLGSCKRVAALLTLLPERLNTWSREVLDRYLTWAMQHRSIVMLMIIAVVSVSVIVAFLVTSSHLPGIDQRRFVVTLLMPAGTTLEATGQCAAIVEQEIGTLQGVKGVYSRIGVTGEPAYGAVGAEAIARGQIEVEVSERGRIDEVMRATRMVLQRVQSRWAGLDYSVTERSTTFEQILRSQRDDIAIRIFGEERSIRDSIAELYVRAMEHVEGLVDVRSSLHRNLPEYRITIDREKAWRLGLSLRDISEFIMNQLKGREVALLSEIDKKITIRLPPGNDVTLHQLLSWSIRSGDRSIPLKALVCYRYTTGLGEIVHEDQQRVRVLTASVRERSVVAVAEDLDRAARSLDLPQGYSISVGGETEEISESFEALFLIIALSIVLIYMILAAEYESLRYPFVILLTGPLAFTGAILAMAAAGQSYNIMSLVGLVVMIGAVDNDAVIAVDIITSLRHRGLGVTDAIRRGMRERLRPILLTTTTTVLGILPLLSEGWTGTELIRALTTPLVGGLIASTVLTLAVVPIVYTWIDGWAMGRR